MFFCVAFFAQNGCTQHKHTGKKHHTKAAVSTEIVPFSAVNADAKAELNAVLSAYLTLKNALAADNGNAAQTAAKTLFAAIDAVEMAKLQGKQHEFWMTYSPKLSYDAEHIKATTEIEHQREHFLPLSKNMYAITKAYKMADRETYYQHCPMANNGKGADWLSTEPEVVNPYMGSKMLTCGKVTETIK